MELAAAACLAIAADLAEKGDAVIGDCAMQAEVVAPTPERDALKLVRLHVGADKTKPAFDHLVVESSATAPSGEESGEGSSE